jgi:hypothetical protein
MKSETVINFWGIGAQKAGTSWLYYNLSKSPGFAIPPVKEFHYFDRDVKYPSPNHLAITKTRDRVVDANYVYKGIRSVAGATITGKIKKAKFYYKWHFLDYGDEWYKSIFDIYNGVKGEITPAYSMLKKEDIERMYAIAPDAKLIFMVRNPVDRAWSHFRHENKRIPGFSLDDVTEQELIEFMKTEGQELRSNYVRTIKNFTSVFPKEQLLIGFYDAIIEAPEQLLNEVIQFILPNSESDVLKEKSQQDKESSLNKIVNKSIELDCPPKILEILKDKYHDMILELATNYGGYFAKWYQDTYDKKIDDNEIVVSPTILVK